MIFLERCFLLSHNYGLRLLHLFLSPSYLYDYDLRITFQKSQVRRSSCDRGRRGWTISLRVRRISSRNYISFLDHRFSRVKKSEPMRASEIKTGNALDLSFLSSFLRIFSPNYFFVPIPFTSNISKIVYKKPRNLILVLSIRIVYPTISCPL